MKLIQKVGLAIFVLAMSIWMVTLSLSEYKLTKEIIQSDLGEGLKVELFQSSAEILLNQQISSKMKFISGLDEAFNSANKQITDRYSITEEEVKSIMNQVQGPKDYQLTYLASVFGESEMGKDKSKRLSDGTGWMVGRDYASKEDLQRDLQNKANELNGYLIEQKGFGKKRIKSAKFSLTKHASVGVLTDQWGVWFGLSFLMMIAGSLMYIMPQLKDGPAGIKHNGIFLHAATNRGWIGIIVGTFLIGFYILLYWFPEYITNWVILVDPLSKKLSGGEASQWFLYGFMYCVAMLVMGVRMFAKYRHNKYQQVRTVSVLFFQLAFAFLIPEILVRFNEPWFDFKNMWPLDYDFFFDIDGLKNSGKLGAFMLVWGIALFAIGVPIITYFFGKRWYCSWVCGCGGLAETLGDPYRQLSDKSVKAWKIERWMIHSVLAFAIIMTGFTLYTYNTNEWTLMGVHTADIQATYGFLIGSAFSGVVGTGFYPLMGNRVWCRFGCPLAAYLGIVQRFKSRFRITTNGGQCISCGNCSTYCEMGIDVRSYAQKGQNIVRSSCVGCGVCAAVCPRGVLKLENGPEEGRIEDNPIIIGNDGVKLNIES